MLTLFPRWGQKVPELPEVETIRRCLEPMVVQRFIKSVWVKRESRLLRDTVSARDFRSRLLGRKIQGLSRRGKYLKFELSRAELLLVHFGMTGSLFFTKHGEKLPAHTHLVIGLSKGDLVLADPRTFGRLMLTGPDGPHPALAKLGPEPLARSFNGPRLFNGLAGRRAALKSILLSQGAVAGVGNIYSDEACFAAGVRPTRPAGSLSALEAGALASSIKKVLKKSIELKGCTISDYHWDQGRSGGFQDRLKVYGREGLACARCGSIIQRAVISGRSAFFCPGCQR